MSVSTSRFFFLRLCRFRFRCFIGRFRCLLPRCRWLRIRRILRLPVLPAAGGQQQCQQQTYRQDSVFHPIHLSIFDPAAMPTHAKYRTSTGSGHGRSRTPHMDTLEQAFKGNLNAISKHICICLFISIPCGNSSGPHRSPLQGGKGGTGNSESRLPRRLQSFVLST